MGRRILLTCRLSPIGLRGLNARIKDLPVVDRQDLQSINARLAELERAQPGSGRR